MHISTCYKLSNLIVKERFSNICADGTLNEMRPTYLQVCASSWCHNLHCGHGHAQLNLSSCKYMHFEVVNHIENLVNNK